MKLIPTKEYEQLVDKAAAFDYTSERAQEAHDYCNQYLKADAWGRNIWHAVLDDAKRMRAKLDELTKVK